MLDRFFRLSENHTNVRTELLAGLTTFLTMAYIIVVQPLVLSGRMFDIQTGMDFGAVTTATCLAAALASAIMGLYGRYPIAQAPGMGENFFFVLSMLPAAGAMIAAQVKAGQLTAGSTTPWQIGLGVEAAQLRGLLIVDDFEVVSCQILDVAAVPVDTVNTTRTSLTTWTMVATDSSESDLAGFPGCAGVCPAGSAGTDAGGAGAAEVDVPEAGPCVVAGAFCTAGVEAGGAVWPMSETAST